MDFNKAVLLQIFLILEILVSSLQFLRTGIKISVRRYNILLR